MLTFTEHKIIRDWKDHVARLHKIFRQKTGSKCTMIDYICALNSEIWWLKRQYPTVRDKLIVDRAYRNLVEAYTRSNEYSVRLTWKSLSSFCLHRRPGILWAVLQARSDEYKPQKKQVEKASVAHQTVVVTVWCERCQTLARVIDGKPECCGGAD